MLDGPGHAVVIREDPAVTVLPEGLEGRVLQIHQLLLDDRLVLPLAALDVHQAGHRGAAHRPLCRQGHKVLHRCDVPGLSRLESRIERSFLLSNKRLLLRIGTSSSAPAVAPRV